MTRRKKSRRLSKLLTVIGVASQIRKLLLLKILARNLSLKKVHEDVHLLQIQIAVAAVAAVVLVATEVKNPTSLQKAGMNATKINLKTNFC